MYTSKTTAPYIFQFGYSRKNYYENEILKILEKNHNSMSNMGVFINETSPNSIITRNSFVNFLAGGMAVARPLGLEIDFVRNPISESAA